MLLAFTSSQCPPCQQMYPHLQTFSGRKANVQIVMITLGSVEENQQLVVDMALISQFCFGRRRWRIRIGYQAHRFLRS